MANSYRKRSSYYNSRRPTPEDSARREARIAEMREHTKRYNFRRKFLLFAAPASAFGYSALTGNWSAIIVGIVLFSVGIGLITIFGGTLLDSYSVLLPLTILAVSTGIVVYQFSVTTTYTWHERVGAVAADGWASNATSSGAASHHGGVDHWITVPHTRILGFQERWQNVLDRFWFLLPLFGASASLVSEHIVLGRRRLVIS